MKFYVMNLKTGKEMLIKCPCCGDTNIDMINNEEITYECLECEHIFSSEEIEDEEIEDENY